MFTPVFFCLICQVFSKSFDISFDNQTPNIWKLAHTMDKPSHTWLRNNFTSEMRLSAYQVSYFHFKIEFYVNGFKVGSAEVGNQRFTVALQTIDTLSEMKEALVFQVDPNPSSSTCTPISNQLLQAASLNKKTITKVIQCGMKILLKELARTEMDKVIDINFKDMPHEVSITVLITILIIFVSIILVVCCCYFCLKVSDQETRSTAEEVELAGPHPWPRGGRRLGSR